MSFQNGFILIFLNWGNIILILKKIKIKSNLEFWLNPIKFNFLRKIYFLKGILLFFFKMKKIIKICKIIFSYHLGTKKNRRENISSYISCFLNKKFYSEFFIFTIFIALILDSSQTEPKKKTSHCFPNHKQTRNVGLWIKPTGPKSHLYKDSPDQPSTVRLK